jgi:acetyl-CoA carboxylase biotin carboxylase subunit
MVTGVDLVQWQIRIARGERLVLGGGGPLAPSTVEGLAPRIVEGRGHAIECRIYAEDADAGFMPSPGHISGLRVPDGPGIRDDSGTEAGADVPIFYDPMISKLIAWGEDRTQEIARMRRALREYDVLGIKTSLPFFRWMLYQPDFVAAKFHTSYLDEVLRARAGEPFTTPSAETIDIAVIAAAIAHTTRSTHPPNQPDQPHPPSKWHSVARAEGLRE